MLNKPVPKAYILVSKDKTEIQKLSAYTAKALSSILKSCLGPRAMQKMILTKINSIELTNDGNSILRELDVSHPSARCLIELSQTQDNECGDGTTTVLILASELLSKIVPLLENIHPIRLCHMLTEARDICLEHIKKASIQAKEDDLLSIVRSAVATKLCTILKIPIPEMAVRACDLISNISSMSIKNDIKIEKIPGVFEESEVLEGIIIEKDLVHSQMRRNIENPRILLLDCPLEYRKGESVTSMEFSKTGDFTKALQIEEESIRKMCSMIIDMGVDLLITEKGICDLALSILHENNITAIRRVRKSDLIRISKATGATIASRLEDTPRIGTAGVFEYIKIGREYFCRLSKCQNPGAVSVILRGPTKDILNELERNFMDAVKVARNVMICPRLVAGGGSIESYLSVVLSKYENRSNEIKSSVFEKCSEALRVIPSIICSNSGNTEVLETLYKLETKHAEGMENTSYFGINGITGEIQDMRSIVMEPIVVKEQCIKSAFECVMQLIRVDGIVESKSLQ